MGNAKIIVIDDGSTDDTEKRLSEILDPRVVKRKTEHVGVSAARNVGLNLASGVYVAFLDADDRWAPNKLEKQLALAKAFNLGAVFTNFKRFNKEGYFPRDHFSYFNEMTNWKVEDCPSLNGVVLIDDAFEIFASLGLFITALSTILIKRSVINDVRFPEHIRIAEDWHFMLRIFEKTNFGYLNDHLVDMRRHDSNSFRPGEDMGPFVNSLYDVEPLLVYEKNRVIMRRRRGQALLALGYHNLWRGDVLISFKAYAKSLAYAGARWNAIKHLAVMPVYLLMRIMGYIP